MFCVIFYMWIYNANYAKYTVMETHRKYQNDNSSFGGYLSKMFVFFRNIL